MPYIGIGLHVLAAIFAMHAIRSGQILYWLILLFSFPLLGSVVYFLAIYFPEVRHSRGGAAGRPPCPQPQCRRVGADQGRVEGLLTPGDLWQACRICLAHNLAGQMPTLVMRAAPTWPTALQRSAPASLRHMQRF